MSAKPTTAPDGRAAKKTAAKKPVAKSRAAQKPSAAAKPATTTAKRASAPPKAAAARKPSADAFTPAAPIVRLKDLIDRVVASAGIKKKDAKPVIEVTLRHLGDALAAGEAMILQPLGRIRVNKTKEAASGDMLTIKLKRPGSGKPARKAAATGLAEDGE